MSSPEPNKLPANIDPQWSKHYLRLLALRARLLQEKDHLTSDAVEETPSYSLHMADAATDQFDCDLALGKLSAEQDALYEIDEALRRIQNGTYGVCELTGQPIPPERLDALPWTRFTAAAAAQLERSGALNRARLGQLGSVHREVTGNIEESEPAEELSKDAAAKDEQLTRVYLPPGQHLHEAKRTGTKKVKRNPRKRR